MNVALIGAGSVGTAVASILHGAGHRIVSVGPPGRRSSERAADRLQSEVAEPRIAVTDADLVLIGTPDGAIGSVATASGPGLREGAVVCHFAGSLGLAPLAPVVEAGAARAAAHPVQACPDADTAVRRLPGSAWGVTCDDAATGRISEMIERDLSGTVVFVAEDERPVWHAATATTANGIAALLALSEDMLSSIRTEDPIAVLGPLAAGTVANAREGGGGAPTLTGPLVRGEVATVKRHLDSLGRVDPDALVAYRRVAAVVLTAAQQSGRIDEVVAARIRDLLEPG